MLEAKRPMSRESFASSTPSVPEADHDPVVSPPAEAASADSLKASRVCIQ